MQRELYSQRQRKGKHHKEARRETYKVERTKRRERWTKKGKKRGFQWGARHKQKRKERTMEKWQDGKRTKGEKRTKIQDSKPEKPGNKNETVQTGKSKGSRKGKETSENTTEEADNFNSGKKNKKKHTFAQHTFAPTAKRQKRSTQKWNVDTKHK